MQALTFLLSSRAYYTSLPRSFHSIHLEDAQLDSLGTEYDFYKVTWQKICTKRIHLLASRAKTFGSLRTEKQMAELLVRSKKQGSRPARIFVRPLGEGYLVDEAGNPYLLQVEA